MSVYNPPTLTGFNSSPPPDDGTQVAANQILWSTILSKIGTPLKNFTEDMNSAIDAAIDTLDSISRDQNLLINGDFAVAQRGTSFTSATTPANSDDTYLLDRWTLLSDGNDIVDVSQETSTIPSGATAAIKLDVETANKKFGIIQIVENRIARSIIGGTCSLSFKARVTGSTIGRIRAAVLAWDGTADTVTSDVVSAWGGAGTNPTLVANWTYENTPADLTALSTTYQTYTIENISIDTASCTNVAVFLWTDDVTMDVGDFLYISDVQLEIGATATTFKRRQFTLEEAMCQRYCAVFSDGSANRTWCVASAISTTVAAGVMNVPVPMRIAPTATISAASDLKTTDSGGENAGSSFSMETNMAPTNGQVTAILTIGAASLTADEGIRIRSATANAKLTLSAEL